LTSLFAEDWGPDQSDREVDRWLVCLKCRTGLSEYEHLRGKPLAGSSSQVDNPATSPSPFPIHSDLPTEGSKYSGSERSGFAEPAHIAAETLLATHRRTRCALKRFADRSQPSLLGVLLEHTQQRLPQVLKPQTEYATFADVEDAQRLPIFLIQEGRPRSWSYRKQGLHGPEMDARRWGKRA